MQATSVTTSLEQSILWKRGGVFLPAVRQKASRFSIGSQETFQFDTLILTHYQCIDSYTLSMQEHQELMTGDMAEMDCLGQLNHSFGLEKTFPIESQPRYYYIWTQDKV